MRAEKAEHEVYGFGELGAFSYPLSYQERYQLFSEGLAKDKSELLIEARELAGHEYRDDVSECMKAGKRLGEKKVDQGFSNFYGLSSVYRHWIGSQNEALSFSVLHSYLLSRLVTSNDNLPGRPVVAYSYPLLEELISANNSYLKRPVITVPGPMEVIRELKSDMKTGEQESKTAETEKCAFFLSHSSSYIKTEYREDDLERIIGELRGRYKYIYGVIYFLDLPLPRSVRNLFDEVLCCGHMQDPLFLIRLYAVLSECKNVSYNLFGGHALHAATLGCSVIHYCPEISLSQTNKAVGRGIAQIPKDFSGESQLGYWYSLAAILAGYEGRDISELLGMLITRKEDGCVESKEILWRMQRSWRAACIRRVAVLIDRWASVLRRLTWCRRSR